MGRQTRRAGSNKSRNKTNQPPTGQGKSSPRGGTDKVADRVEGEDLPVFEKTLPDPGKHPLAYIIDTMLILLGLVAVLSMFLSALLVVNVVSALIDLE